jgi:hypothetical protein
LHHAFVLNNAFGRKSFHTDGLQSANRAPEEFPTNLTLRIEYRIGERDLNLFFVSENVMTIAEFARRRTLYAAYEPVTLITIAA